MNISRFYIPNRPCCLGCGFEHDDVKEVGEHIEENHPKWDAYRCGEATLETVPEFENSRMIKELSNLLQVLSEETVELFKIATEKMIRENNPEGYGR